MKQRQNGQSAGDYGIAFSREYGNTEYSDVLACRLIEQITVLSKTEIQIRFVGGYEVEQLLL